MSLESSSSQQSQNSTSASTSFKCVWTCKHAHEGLYQGQCCSQEGDQFQLLLKCWLALSLSLSLSISHSLTRCPAFDSFLPGAVLSQFRASIKLCNFAIPCGNFTMLHKPSPQLWFKNMLLFHKALRRAEASIIPCWSPAFILVFQGEFVRDWLGLYLPEITW